MNLLDMGLVGIVAAFAGIGALRGWTMEALSLAVWVLAGAIAWFFADDAAPWFAQGVVDPVGQRILAFVALFVVSFIVLSVANFIFRMVVFNPAKDKWSRIFGALLGCLRGVAVASILVGLAGLTRVPQESWWKESVVAPPFQKVTLTLVSFLPSDLADQFRY